MRKKLFFTSALCAAGLFLSGKSVAADNVYVDLSVLDTAPRDSIGFVSSRPLFPVVKKAPVQKPQKKIVRPEPAKPQPPVVEKVEEVKDEIKETVLPVEETELPQKQEENAPQVTENEVVSEPATEETIVNEQPAVTEEIDTLAPSVDNGEKASSAVETAPVPQNEEVFSAKMPEDELQEETAVIGIMPKEVYSLSFADGFSELSEENNRRLEEIIKLFDKDGKKKIVIKAYNYDDGQNSFLKKRISLTRATEVRSFFLNRGFKNFSIKIINTTPDNEYKNTVELEELD